LAGVSPADGAVYAAGRLNKTISAKNPNLTPAMRLCRCTCRRAIFPPVPSLYKTLDGRRQG